jgi:hypothetical protein
MNCDEYRARYLAGEEDDMTRTHLAECASCRVVHADLEVGRRALMDPVIWEEPPAELENQVVALISGQRNDERPGTGRFERWSRPLAAVAAIVVAAGLYAVLRTPPADWEVAMPGTDLAPGATSTVSGWNTDAGTRMIVAVQGLGPAPAGWVYEFWLSEGPLHISAGTFTADGEIELWSGVSRADFPRLWVTLEPVDEDESPSGHTVLDTEA